MPQLFFRPKYVWFPVHLKGPMIPDPSGQLAELIVYITTTRVDLHSHQIPLTKALLCDWGKTGAGYVEVKLVHDMRSVLWEAGIASMDK